MEKNYKYLGYALMLLVPITFIGFYRTYFSQFPDFINLKGVHHFHAAVAGAWLGMLIVQPFLIRAKKLTWHKRLGKVSYVVLPTLIISMVMMIMLQGPNYTLQGVFVPGVESFLIALFYTLAIVNKKRSDLHMRYMIASALVFINPTIGRLFIAAYGVEHPTWFHFLFTIIYSILIGLILFDRANGKNFKPYVVASLIFITYHVGVFIVYLQ